jgi:AAA domain (dynein-related subfamily)
MDINSAKKIIKAAVYADDSVIMEGLHGIGKSEIVKQFAKENDYHLEELFLSHQEVGDLIGIPHMIEKDGKSVTTWSVPIWLQRMYSAQSDGKNCILFLDELNRAPIDVRQSALQLVLERKIHEHSLPELNGQRTIVVSAINPSDEYQTDDLDPALLDRFLFINVEVDVPVWLKWAKENEINNVVRDFISEHPDRLHFTPADGGIGATPRSWAKLSKFIDNINDIEEEILFQIIKGKIGSAVGSQFYMFLSDYNKVIKIEDIENIVKKESKKTDDIHIIAEKIYELIENAEPIKKIELANQLFSKYMNPVSRDILPYLAYLYSLEPEICHGYLTTLRKDENEKWNKLVQIDSEINNKELFKRIAKKIN